MSDAMPDEPKRIYAEIIYIREHDDSVSYSIFSTMNRRSPSQIEFVRATHDADVRKELADELEKVRYTGDGIPAMRAILAYLRGEAK